MRRAAGDYGLKELEIFCLNGWKGPSFSREKKKQKELWEKTSFFLLMIGMLSLFSKAEEKRGCAPKFFFGSFFLSEKGTPVRQERPLRQKINADKAHGKTRRDFILPGF